MPRSKRDIALEKVVRSKDQTQRLRKATSESVAQGGRLMVAALDADIGVTRTDLALVWKTSLSQIDRMVAKARSERGG